MCINFYLVYAATFKILILFFFSIPGSQITKSWRTFMDELEQVSRQLKLNAEHLESVCQDRLTQLYHDKRKARKHYQEEHLKISTQFSHVSCIKYCNSLAL